MEKYLGLTKEKFNQVLNYWNFIYPDYHVDTIE
jgi:hypothetical protein